MHGVGSVRFFLVQGGGSVLTRVWKLTVLPSASLCSYVANLELPPNDDEKETQIIWRITFQLQNLFFLSGQIIFVAVAQCSCQYFLSSIFISTGNQKYF